MSNPKVQELLKHFRLTEADYHALAQDPGWLAELEAFLGKTLERFDPYLRQGIALESAAVGGLAGGAGPVVTILSTLIENASLSFVERWLASRRPPASPSSPPSPGDGP